MQRAERLARRLALVERARLRQRVFRIEMGEGLDVGLDRRDPVEAGAGIVLGRDGAARDLGGGLRWRSVKRVLASATERTSSVRLLRASSA